MSSGQIGLGLPLPVDILYTSERFLPLMNTIVIHRIKNTKDFWDNITYLIPSINMYPDYDNGLFQRMYIQIKEGF